ncbi:MAG TPA: 30S ribosome-binding factor RbfA [Usitatibacter sp.]|nr:30S ribosome-binding factor RbfA [Usitatibacter sp.]
MPVTAARSARIADQIQRELAEVVRMEVRDPRVGLVTLTGVELSRDQSHAKVFFTVLGADAEEALEGLQRASGFLRSELAHRLTIRKVPELHFAYDESVERGMRLSRLIDEAVRPSAAPAPARKPRARKPP